ncbi:YkgJ family cysteine cluster protein [Salmonella enterica subsp. diarizonae]|nr:YkgJ family cysteine cluster protein [Salmonella enterica subsp. diarizonae]ECF5951326.1 YkgJ family cysteine cluster protein [Salmonella enterica subsp. diarizonae]
MNHYPTIDKLKGENSFCPFLDKSNASCTIYSVRHLACRTSESGFN